MATPIDTGVDLVYDVPTATVSTKDNWADEEWTVQPYLYANRAKRALMPTMDDAELERDYGQKIRPDDTTIKTYSKLDINGKFVKIAFTPNSGTGVSPETPQAWHGYIIDTHDDSQGAAVVVDNDGNNVRVPEGKQVFKAIGLEYFLARKVLTTTIIEFLNEIINRAIGFNTGGGDRRDTTLDERANKDPNSPPLFPVFAADLKTKPPATPPELWNGIDILRYCILNENVPLDADGLRKLPFKTGAGLVYLEWMTPTIHREGRSIFSILNALIGTKRGLSWALRVDGNEDIRIDVFTHRTTIGTLRGGLVQLPAGANRQKTLDYDIKTDVMNVTHGVDFTKKFSRVRVRGARRGCCFTMNLEDGTFDEDWDFQTERDYLDGASAEPDYDSELAEWRQRNDTIRTEEKFRDVYSSFKLPDDWDGKAGDGEGNKEFVCFALDAQGRPNKAKGEKFWQAGLRIKNHLPLLTGRDYDGSKANVGGHPIPGVTVKSEHLKPFAVIQVDREQTDAEGAATGRDAFQYIDKLSEGGTIGTIIGEEGVDWSASMRAHDSQLGIRVNVSGAQHKIAGRRFDPAIDEPTEDKNFPVLDYLTIEATVFVDWDAHAEAIFPEAKFDKPQNELLINLGDRARMDWVVPGTLVAIKDGELIRSRDGGFVRNDYREMADLAEVAYDWYKVDRQTIDITYDQITVGATIGDIILQVGKAETLATVNTMVSQVTWDFQRGTTSIKTDFAELDFAEFF